MRAVALAVALIAGAAAAHGAIVKRSLLPPDGGALVERLGSGDLETVEGSGFAACRPYRLGYAVDAETSRSGSYSVRCSNASETEHRGLLFIVDLDQTTAAPIIAECWSKAERVSGGRDGDYSLYLDLELADGTPLWGQVAPFDPGTHDWQRRGVHVVPPKPIRRVYVYALLRNRSGAAWFDDLKLYEPEHAEQADHFDGVPVMAGATREVRFVRGPRLETDDGFALDFDAVTGDVRTGSPGGLFFRDVAAGSDFIRPEGSAEAVGDRAVRRGGRDDGSGIQLTATYQIVGNAIRIDGEVEDLTGAERAITVYFSYPVDAVGWQWHDDQTTAQTVVQGEKYANLVSVGLGANGLASRYPLACISSDDVGLALAVPLDVPRLCRLGYDAGSRELYAAFDLGLSPDIERYPSKAGFSLVMYRCDAEWGFRAALQRYYKLFPQHFTKRNEREGIWMPFTDIATVEGFQDFGFQFKEGDNNPAFDEQHGICTFHYVEPWSQWIRMPDDVERTERSALAFLAQRGEEGDPRAAAVTSSGIEDAQGRPAVRMADFPWCDGAVFGLNPSPAVEAGGDALTQFEHEWGSIERAYERHPELDGTYIDSYEMYLFRNYGNYRREHFTDARHPLVFDRDGRVCQSEMFNMLEFTEEIAGRIWGRGGMMFANGALIEFPWSARWLDVAGTETDWGPQGQYRPDSRAQFNYWRALSYQRPYLLLLNTRYDLFEPEWVELYMKRCAAYGVFPSMFSHNASEDPYWQNPDLYNRDRPLFKKYVPVIAKLNAAGWEPITYARSDQEDVYVERFGAAGGKLYFTVFNDSDAPRQAALTLDLVGLGVREAEVWDVLAGEPLATGAQAGKVRVDLELGPQDVRVLALQYVCAGRL